VSFHRARVWGLFIRRPVNQDACGEEEPKKDGGTYPMKGMGDLEAKEMIGTDERTVWGSGRVYIARLELKSANVSIGR